MLALEPAAGLAIAPGEAATGGMAVPS